MDLPIGRKVAIQRKMKNLSQVQLGKKLNINRSSVSKIETGIQVITPMLAKELGHIFQVPTTYFLPAKRDENITQDSLALSNQLFKGELELAKQTSSRLIIPINHFHQELEASFLLAACYYSNGEYEKALKLEHHFLKICLAEFPLDINFSKFDTLGTPPQIFTFYYQYLVNRACYQANYVDGEQATRNLLLLVADETQRLAVELTLAYFLLQQNKLNDGYLQGTSLIIIQRKRTVKWQPFSTKKERELKL